MDPLTREEGTSSPNRRDGGLYGAGRANPTGADSGARRSDRATSFVNQPTDVARWIHSSIVKVTCNCQKWGCRYRLTFGSPN